MTRAKYEALFVLHRLVELLYVVTFDTDAVALLNFVEFVGHYDILCVQSQIVAHHLENTENRNVDTSNCA
jgi:hypothetical protein